MKLARFDNTMETIAALKSGQLQGTQRLTLSCGLTEFPLEILDLADSLEILDLSNNHLKSLPDDFARLQNLRIAFFSKNEFEEVPEVLSRCPRLSMLGFKSTKLKTVGEKALPPNLRWLILTDNQIEQLPRTIGQLHNLQKLMLAGNQLQSLPAEMSACQNLELIRLSANCFQTLPSWLFSLPRLSWLAYAGNPGFPASALADRPLPTIEWADLTLGEVLGQGASGIISRGIWRKAPTDSEAVAIKLFRGEMTSDGLPTDEMKACIAAGSHDHLVNVLGRVVNHPEDKAGLVLSLLPADYCNLGDPPDFETCTRDTYRSDTIFSLAFILRVLRGVVAVATHLHHRGILHGDLYAHNSLVNGQGDCLLGDFGAASFYDPGDVVMGPALERLESRAFGCLLEDLLIRCRREDGSAQPGMVDRLHQLHRACMEPDISLRPRFVEIDQILSVNDELYFAEA